MQKNLQCFHLNKKETAKYLYKKVCASDPTRDRRLPTPKEKLQ